MKISQSSESLVFDFRTLRVLIGAIAIAFPAVVYVLTGKITTSISASYHEAQTHDVFVGFLFILGALPIPFLKGSIRKAYLMLIPALAILARRRSRIRGSGSSAAAMAATMAIRTG